MKPKKNKKADLNRRGIIFLQTGLILVLLLAYLGLEWKTYAVATDSKDQITYAEPEEEVIPITTPPQATPPPPPKTIIDKIEPIDNDEPDEAEDNTESLEDNIEDIVDVDDIVEAPEDDEPEKVPFEFIEDVPIFPGCETLKDNGERKTCMSEKITKYINREFDKSLGEKLGLSGITRINVMFMINKKGEVTDIQIRAPHSALEQEAREIIENLPDMQPGKQRGKPVNVSYALPIIFKVD